MLISLVMAGFYKTTASCLRGSGIERPLQRNVKLLIADAGPGFFAWIFVALEGVVTSTRKTHIATNCVCVCFSISSRTQG